MEESAELDKSLIENQKIFIENMTHEIRTPVTAILAFAELLSFKTDITDEK